MVEKLIMMVSFYLQKQKNMHIQKLREKNVKNKMILNSKLRWQLYYRHIDSVLYDLDCTYENISLNSLKNMPDLGVNACEASQNVFKMHARPSNPCLWIRKKMIKYSLIKLPFVHEHWTVKISSLLSDKIFNGLIDFTAFRSFAIFNRIVGPVSVCMGPYLICCKHIVFHISSKLFDGTLKLFIGLFLRTILYGNINGRLGGPLTNILDFGIKSKYRFFLTIVEFDGGAAEAKSSNKMNRHKYTRTIFGIWIILNSHNTKPLWRK